MSDEQFDPPTLDGPLVCVVVDGDLLGDCIADAVPREWTDEAARAIAERALDNAVQRGMTVLHGSDGTPRQVAPVKLRCGCTGTCYQDEAERRGTAGCWPPVEPSHDPLATAEGPLGGRARDRRGRGHRESQ